jgi:folylpolyglutamate synthase/dihydropteroate synthase
MVKQLSALKPVTVTCSATTATGARPAADPKILAKLFKAACPKAVIKISPNPLAAYKQIRPRLKPDDILLVTGSIYFSGQLRKIG